MKTWRKKLPLKSTVLVTGLICLLQLYARITDAISSNLLIYSKQNNEHQNNNVSQLYVLTAAVKKIMPSIKMGSERHFKAIGKKSSNVDTSEAASPGDFPMLSTENKRILP